MGERGLTGLPGHGAIWRTLCVGAQASLGQLARLLEGRGHAVEWAGGPEAALERLRREGYDLVVVDQPGGGGLLLQGVRTLPRGAASTVLAVVAAGDEAAIAEAIQAGASGVLARPFDEGVAATQIAAAEARRRRAARIGLDPDDRYQVLFEANPNPMWFYDLETLAFLAVNDAAVERYGYARQEFLRMTIKDIRPPEDVPRLLANVAEVAGGLAHAGTWRHRRRDGTVFDVEIVSYAVPFGGRPAELVLALDVSERRRTIEALEESERRFRQFAESVPEAFWLRDLDPPRVLYANPACQAVFGLGPERLLRDPDAYLEVVHPPDREAMRAQVEGGEAGPGAYRVVGAEGRPRWVSVRAFPVPDARGRAVRVGAIVTDVTERRAMRERLAMADRLASVGTLAAGVAHEINNPLTYVIANLEFLARQLAGLRDAGGEAGRLAASSLEALEEAREGAGRVRAIARDLRIFSRGDEEAMGAVDVRQVLESALAMAANEIRHRARVETEWGAVPPVRGSAGRLGQVFLNLVVNAAQAVPVGDARRHRIRIATRREGDRVVAEVSDTGEGIPPEHLHRIFDPFFTTKPVGVGTGLGLSISHSIVASLGGEIAVRSEPGRGSTFEVRLPVAKEAPAPEAPAAAEVARSGPRRRLLVVDDEELIGRAVRRVLGDECEVVVESSAGRALARVEEGERYDLILVDMMMPQMTGAGFHEALAAVDSRQARRVVFVTGGAFAGPERAFLERTENERMEKPIDFDRLRALLRRAT